MIAYLLKPYKCDFITLEKANYFRVIMIHLNKIAQKSCILGGEAELKADDVW
jgi:hypothetical protein